MELVVEFQLYPRIVSQIAEKFEAAKIPMIALDNPHPGAVYFGANNYKAGHIAGTYLGDWAVQNWGGWWIWRSSLKLRLGPAKRILVGTVNDPSALGALQAFRDLGRKDGCAIVRQDSTPDARHEMRRPKT